MSKIIGMPLGYIMYWCFLLVKDYGVALILFTLLTKLLLLPLAVKQQKNTAHMAAFSPKLEKLKKKHGTNKEKYNEEMMKLYSEEGVNPMASCLPLLIQMPILFGLIDVVYRPLTHLLRFSKTTITAAQTIITGHPELFKAIISNSNFKNRPELYIMEAVKQSPSVFTSPDLGADFVNKVQHFHYSFLGFNMGEQPTLKSILIFIPIISFLANLLLTVYTQKMNKKTNPSAQQMGAGMNAMLYIMPVFSAFFAFSVPAGVGVYWILSSLFAFAQAVLLYKVYTPEKVLAMVAKDQAKKKKKPSLYQRMAAQAALQNGGKPALTSSSDSSDDAEANLDVLSKSAIKDLQRKKLADARKRMAEKYGETYDDSIE